MTRSYIIWHEKIWVKYIVRAFWQMDYNMLTEYWIVKIQYCNYLHNNTIGQIIRYQDYYWPSIKLKIVEMFFVRLVDVPHGWRNRGDPKQGQRTRQEAHHPSSFHCCQPQDPSHVFVLPSLLALCMCLCALPLVFVCPRKLLKERATNQGVTRPAWWKGKALSF